MQKRFVFSYQYVHKLLKKKLGTSFTDEKKDMFILDILSYNKFDQYITLTLTN